MQPEQQRHRMPPAEHLHQSLQHWLPAALTAQPAAAQSATAAAAASAAAWADCIQPTTAVALSSAAVAPASASEPAAV